MSISERMAAYAALEGSCYCGLAKGHVGWLVCVFGQEAADAPEIISRRIDTEPQEEHPPPDARL